MNSSQQCVRQPGGRQLGKRCPASNVYNSLLVINMDGDVLRPAMCRIAWWPPTRKDMFIRQQCVRQPQGYPSHCWWEDISILVDGHQAIFHIAGGRTSLAQLMATRLSYTLARDVLPPAMCTIDWWPSTRIEMSFRQQGVGQTGGHQLEQRCPSASNMKDSFVAISQDRDMRPSTRKEISSRQQYLRQPGGHQLGKRCPPTSNMMDRLVFINQERYVPKPAM